MANLIVIQDNAKVVSNLRRMRCDIPEKYHESILQPSSKPDAISPPPPSAHALLLLGRLEINLWLSSSTANNP